MPPKKKVSPANSTTSTTKTMKTTATARKTASRPRAAPATLRAGGGAARPAARPTGTRPAAGRKPAPLRPAIRKTGAAPPAARKRVTTTTPVKIRKRFQPPPPPPMYWICYDFMVKLVRGLCLGVAIGLVLTVVIPWVLDTGFFFYDKVQDGDLVLPKMPNVGMSNLTSLMNGWGDGNSTKLLWRVDQKSQQSSSDGNQPGNKVHQFLRHTPKPTRDPKEIDDEHLRQNFPRTMNRTILLVHVGHTGGRSIMDLCPKIACKAQFAHLEEATQLQGCLQRAAVQQDAAITSPLAAQTQHYFHLGHVAEDEVAQSTSFLFTLRNPVDRLLSIFVDSHPLACTDAAAALPPNQQPWGCMTKQYWRNMPSTLQYSFYTKCFPQPQPEQFGQMVLYPWPDAVKDIAVETAQQQKHDCRWMARTWALGADENEISLGPHAFHNYQFYAARTFRGTGKEVLAIRGGEHETADLQLLHTLMGGDAKTILPHGTPPRATPQVSNEAYRKLCCVLHDEIAQYETILKRVANLPDYEKDATMDDVRVKCGIASNTEDSWAEWRRGCVNQMELDEMVLSPGA